MSPIICSIPINASKETIWKTITDWENAAERISGINSIEILNKPASGIVGLKWKETRTMFGREAIETMWVTEAQENDYYRVGAESHGSKYDTRMSIEERNGENHLVMSFSAQPISAGAKVMSFLMGRMMKGAVRKAFDQDLADIKAAVEG
ncbi:MAG: SRPBCC family protein [Bacteroidota bacterium]